MFYTAWLQSCGQITISHDLPKIFLKCSSLNTLQFNDINMFLNTIILFILLVKNKWLFLLLLLLLSIKIISVNWTIGHVDAGKSTLMGHLLYQLGEVNQRMMHKYENESKKLGKGSFAYAWVLDETEEERYFFILLLSTLYFCKCIYRSVCQFYIFYVPQIWIFFLVHGHSWFKWRELFNIIECKLLRTWFLLSV